MYHIILKELTLVKPLLFYTSSLCEKAIGEVQVVRSPTNRALILLKFIFDLAI